MQGQYWRSARIAQLPLQIRSSQERLTIQEAIWGYTMGPAIASGQEYHLGSLSPGKLADLVVLDRDIFAISPQEIPEINVVMTIINGKVVFRAR